MQTRRFVLACRPQGVPRETDFRLETRDLPALQEGQILVANAYASVDPGMRARLGEEATYAAPLQIGETVEGATVGRVIASRNPKFSEGDWVAAAFGWSEHGLSEGRGVRKIADQRVPLSAQIGVLGIPGITAYFGMLDIGKPKAGETVVVSSAAGAVGSAAGQIAAIHGARAVGIAGGGEKCAWLRTIGFAEAIDRRAEPELRAAVARACPSGVDVLFDNVGNAFLDAMLPLMRPGGRIVVSGQVADYNTPAAERPGLRNTSYFITARLTMRGLVAFDYFREFPKAWADLTQWIIDGKLQYREDIDEGFENLPRAFIGLFSGDNFGRKLVHIAPRT
jgi:NADPH-dependent curcumin reductase CurA